MLQSGEDHLQKKKQNELDVLGGQLTHLISSYSKNIFEEKYMWNSELQSSSYIGLRVL